MRCSTPTRISATPSSASSTARPSATAKPPANRSRLSTTSAIKYAMTSVRCAPTATGCERRPSPSGSIGSSRRPGSSCNICSNDTRESQSDFPTTHGPSSRTKLTSSSTGSRNDHQVQSVYYGLDWVLVQEGFPWSVGVDALLLFLPFRFLSPTF